VIQNAKVNVFQPGTSNNFLGSAFTAVSGGSGVTNPMTTNSQGEVEAWFDTAQTVDIQVDDNSDTAYRAVNGSSATVSFTTFIEADDIYPDAGLHGIAEHTNRTRTIWLGSLDGFAQTGAALTTLGTEPDSVRYMAFVDAATNSAVWNFVVPNDWNSGALTAQVFWIPISTDGVAHTVRWSYVCKKRGAGDDVTAAGTTTTFTGTSAARTANIMVIDTATSTGVTPGVGGSEVVQFTLRRIGADGADTYVGTVGVIGVAITYTSDE
jgi:hypothetical protein